MGENVFIAEPNRVQAYLHYYRLTLQKKKIEVCNLAEYIYHSIVSSDSWLERTRLVFDLPQSGLGVGLRPNACWHTTNENTLIEAIEKGIEGGATLSLWIHEQPLNPFQRPHDWAKENQQYFDRIRQTWEADFQKMKTNDINLILDLYNDYIKQYKLTCNPIYAKSARSLLEQLEKPYR